MKENFCMAIVMISVRKLKNGQYYNAKLIEYIDACTQKAILALQWNAETQNFEKQLNGHQFFRAKHNILKTVPKQPSAFLQ